MPLRRTVLGQLRQTQGRTDDARGAYEEALAMIGTIAAGITDDGLRTAFLASAAIVNLGRAVDS